HREASLMWHPPMALTLAAPPIAARPRQTRKVCGLLRAPRHARLDADVPHRLAHSERPELGGQAPVEAGLGALAPLVQAESHGRERAAGALTVRDQRGPWGRDGRGAAQPPCSPGPWGNVRLRLIAHHLAKTLLDRTVAG